MGMSNCGILITGEYVGNSAAFINLVDSENQAHLLRVPEARILVCGAMYGTSLLMEISTSRDP